jgi:GR25 family glycosyltransferase involved in LPS biosynthesis
MTAIRGEDISRDDGIRLGLASQDLYDSGLLTPGALGCAASHRTLWQQCHRDNTPLLVLEDDCTTHPDIASFIQDNLQTLLDSDVCFLGLNTDSIVQSISPQGVMRVSVFDPQHPSQAWIKATLKQTEARTVALHRLVKGFGLWAYVVSPQGARKLLDGALPLSLATTNVPLLSEAMPAISLDRAACGVYGQLNALVCQPFLAYAPNEGGAVA